MYQSTTLIWPSGLRLGTSRKITLSRTCCTRGDSSVARRWTSSSTICDGADLGRVDVAGDDDDRLAGLEDLVALGVGRHAVLEVQPALQAAVVVEVLQRVRRRDFEGDERIAFGRLAQVRARARGPTRPPPAGSTRRSCPIGPAWCPRRRGTRGTAPVSAAAGCGPAPAATIGLDESTHEAENDGEHEPGCTHRSLSLGEAAPRTPGAAAPGTIADFGPAGEARYRTRMMSARRSPPSSAAPGASLGAWPLSTGAGTGPTGTSLARAAQRGRRLCSTAARTSTRRGSPCWRRPARRTSPGSGGPGWPAASSVPLSRSADAARVGVHARRQPGRVR